MDRERAGRYGRAARRWARLLASGRARPGFRVFYGWDRDSRPGRAGRRRHRQAAEARRPLAEPADGLLAPLPRDARTCPATSDRSSGCAGREACADRRQPGRRRLSGLGRRPDGRAQRAPPARGARRRPRPLPERVQQAVVRPVPRRAARAAGRSSRMRSTSTGSPRGDAAARTAGRAARRRPDAGVPARARAPDVPARPRRPPGRTTARQRPPRRSDPEPIVRRLGLGSSVELLGRYSQAEAPDVFRRAHVLLHTKVNDPCPTLGDRGDGVRRARRVPGERRHRRARRRRGRGRRAAPGRLRARRASCARRRSRTPWTRRPRRPRPLRGRRARASGRAVRARADWLERHAAIFAELVLAPTQPR